MSTALRDILQMGGAVAHRFLGIAADHDSGFYAHLLSVAPLAHDLALHVGLDREDAVRCGLAGLLHDIGKILIEPDILNAPRALTELEWAEMRQHPEVGARLVRGLNDTRIVDMIRQHHDRLDGSGYGVGLIGKQIPLTTRVLSVADAYAVIREGRPYAAGLERPEALKKLGDLEHLFDHDVVVELRRIESRSRAA